MLVVVHLDTDVSVDERYRSDIVKRECHEVDLGMLQPFPRGLSKPSIRRVESVGIGREVSIAAKSCWQRSGQPVRMRTLCTSNSVRSAHRMP
jgi:hypothetical protein